MEKTAFHHRTITDIVEHNYVYAYALYHSGIRFYEHTDDTPDNTLEQVCRGRGLNMAQVVQSLQQVGHPQDTQPVALENLPIGLVIEYLRHAHAVFIKRKLPYMAHLVETLRQESFACTRDLQIIFPLFVEDFILHIHEEEDTFFRYVDLLRQARQRQISPGRIFFDLEKHSVQLFAIEHETHDDEMTGIREITNQYTLPDGHTPHLKVVFAELKAFEQDLTIHARIENEILFPKALVLEKEVKDMVRQTAQWN